MTRSVRTRARAAIEAAAGAAWIGAVAIAATGLFKGKRSPAKGAAAPPPPPPALSGAPPPPPPAKRDKGPRHRRWATPIAATALMAALGLPGASLGLNLLSGHTDEAPHFTAVSAGVETSQSAKGMMRFRREVFDARPSPSPTPEPEPPPPEPEVVAAPEPAPPPPAPAGSVVAIIHAAAERHGVSGDWMVSIAQCESGLNPRAVNPAGYYGLFQFSKSTWGAYGSGDIFDPAAQSEATAKMLANGGSGHWPNCA